MGPYISLQCASCHSGFYVVLKIFVPVTYGFIEFWWLQGGVCMYVATRGLFEMKLPTVIVPVGIKPTVEKLFDVHRELDGSELEHCLLGLDVGMPCSPSFVPS
jgi:hypothetical protein